MFAFILQQFIVKQRRLQNSIACKNRNWQVGHGILNEILLLGIEASFCY